MSEIQVLQDFVYLRVEKEKEDTIETKVGSLYIDSRFEHGLHHRIYGTVISVPRILTSNVKMPFLREEIGIPYPKTDFDMKFVTLADIEPVVRVGDKIYFHFNTVTEDNRFKEHFADTHSKVFKVRYDQIICVVRDGEIIPVGTWTLVEKVFDPDVQDIEIDGRKVKVKTTTSGLVTEVNVKPRPLAGTIAYIGAPFKCDPELDLSSGDQVLFTKESDWVNKIEGKEYYVMRQRDIIAKYEHVSN